MVQANRIIHIGPTIIFFMVVCAVGESYQRFSFVLFICVWGGFAQYGVIQFYCYISFFFTLILLLIII